ncbi:MAG: 50S ribosomal protein L24 [Minisyncoccia bacterium]|jgi:large subunit ribosomal protein L24
MNIKKGDQVKIMSGMDRGKIGTVLHALPDEGRVVIEGLNVFKKRSRPKKQGQKGETVLVPRPMPVSKVMLVCSNCKNPTRAGFHMDGPRKVRYCKKCKVNT